VIPIVPDKDDQLVKQLIDKIGVEAQPIFVELKPETNATPNECFPNVAKKIKEEGGSQVIGWQIWQTKNLIEAEFHAVWKSRNDELIDITPKPFHCSQILFIQDIKRHYNGTQVDNIRINVSGDALVDDLILVCESIFKIENKGSRAFKYELDLHGDELRIWEFLRQMKDGLNLMLNQGLTKYQTCFCGRSKYRKCHGKMLTQIQSSL
jgi:hypothetical protein